MGVLVVDRVTAAADRERVWLPLLLPPPTTAAINDLERVGVWLLPPPPAGLVAVTVVAEWVVGGWVGPWSAAVVETAFFVADAAAAPVLTERLPPPPPLVGDDDACGTCVPA